MSAESSNLEVMLNVSFPLSVELGRSSMRLEDILKLAAGSLVKLDRSAGAPVDLFVGETLVGRGEIVAVDDRYGICITEVVAANLSAGGAGAA